MRVCQFRHFGNEVRQRTTRRGDGNYVLYSIRCGGSVKPEIAVTAVIGSSDTVASFQLKQFRALPQ